MKLKIKKILNWVLIFLGFTALIYIIRYILCFTDIPRFLFGGTNNQNFNGEFVKFVATIFGGLLVLFGLWLNYKRTKNLENQTKVLEKQTKNQAKQIQAFVDQNKITEKGKVDERFKNAIEHLGSEKDAIVLGGIYALHRIAEEDKSYRQTVFDILCSYIREKTSTLKDWSDYSVDERTAIKPAIVIQTIIDLLFKTADDQEYIYEGLTANLSGIKCINANFSIARLKEANLNSAHLEGAHFYSAILEEAFLQNASLAGANLDKTHIEGAYLHNTNFKEASLKWARLTGAYLSNANMEGAELSMAHLECADLRLANFKMATMDKAQLKECVFDDADFSEASFIGAHLEDVHLMNVNLISADLSEAHLEGADLYGAYLEGANLQRTHLEGTNLNGTHFEGANMTGTHMEGACVNQTYLQGAFIKNANFEGVYSSEYYANFLQPRIGEFSEFSSVRIGKLDETTANDIIAKFSKMFADKQPIIDDFTKIMMKAVKRNTNIEDQAITGILTKEKADEIIERYNKAMANVPKR